MIEESRETATSARIFLQKQGFYIVLFVCLFIVGTAIVLAAYPGENPESQVADNSMSIETETSTDESLKNIKKTPLPTATPSPTPLPTASPVPSAKPTSKTVSSVKKGSAPLQGDIINPYADNALIYSRTLDQWTTHPGIDIAAKEGTDVRAVLSGTVDRVYEDDALGQVVTVLHTNGRTSLYANLDTAVPVTEGQKVNAGDVIGRVGATAISECADLPHLHLGFFVDSVPADPSEYVTLPH